MRKLKSRRHLKLYYLHPSDRKRTGTPDNPVVLLAHAKGRDYSGHGINTRKILRGRIAEQKKILANLQST